MDGEVDGAGAGRVAKADNADMRVWSDLSIT